MNTGIINLLKKDYPTAREGYIEILVEALELHAKKNHDYNGTSDNKLGGNLEMFAKFHDIRRKYSRLYHIIVEDEKAVVDEKLIDTVVDLGNYAFLLAEHLKSNDKNI